MEKLKLVVSLVSKEYLFFSMNPYVFFLAKIKIIVDSFFKKIKLVANKIRMEYMFFSIHPYDFFIGKIEKAVNIYLNKTREQKIIFLVTVSFLILDTVIIYSNTFDILAVFKFFPHSLVGEKWNIYLSFLLIQSILKFMILSYYNFNNFWHNFKTSIPYFGGFYAAYFFIFSEKKKP